MIGGELADFVQSGVAIHIGTRDDGLQPQGARAISARVEREGRYLVVYVSERAAKRILPNLESNGEAAVAFVRPTDDRACQIKGRFVGARAARPAERQALAAQWASFFRNMAQIGIPATAAAGWAIWPAVAIRIEPAAVFDQTPGPHAGAPLA